MRSLPMTQVVLICAPDAQDAEISHGGHEFIPYREDGRWVDLRARGCGAAPVLA